MCNAASIICLFLFPCCRQSLHHHSWSFYHIWAASTLTYIGTNNLCHITILPSAATIWSGRSVERWAPAVPPSLRGVWEVLQKQLLHKRGVGSGLLTYQTYVINVQNVFFTYTIQSPCHHCAFDWCSYFIHTSTQCFIVPMQMSNGRQNYYTHLYPAKSNLGLLKPHNSIQYKTSCCNPDIWHQWDGGKDNGRCEWISRRQSVRWEQEQVHNPNKGVEECGFASLEHHCNHVQSGLLSAIIRQYSTSRMHCL